MMRITGQIVDIRGRRIYSGELLLSKGKIIDIRPIDHAELRYILPGFIDAHVHIESSMLVPSEFAKLALPHGTVATISDPHEIANILGLQGVYYMLQNASMVPMKIFFGAPSCVPATSFEQAGASLGPDEVEELLREPAVKYLAEMMNYPGVLNNDPDVHRKIQAARNENKPVDGHAPGLRGNDMETYFAAGIHTDHECITLEEGREKAEAGVHILIREGSAAKNFEALIPLLKSHPDQIMFCSDDKHPDDLVKGHIDQIVARTIGKGFDLFDALAAACLNPVKHYDLDVGTLRVGDAADFITVKNLQSFEIEQVFVDGQLVVDNGQTKFQMPKIEVINKFNIGRRKTDEFRVFWSEGRSRIIKAIDGELITDSLTEVLPCKEGLAATDKSRDLLKISVVNRYKDTAPAVAFIKGFGLQLGAFASCVAHDSHNIIAVGVDDDSIARSINLIVDHKGGISAVSPHDELVLPLPVAGIMSVENGSRVAAEYGRIDHFVKETLGSQLSAPFMTLSFMALLVIPSLKLSDRGLFDGSTFTFVPLFEREI